MPGPPDPELARDLRQHLRHRGISDSRVLDAMAAVPRHRFVPHSMQASAWDDRALPIACDQTISQPSMVALMTQELALRGTEKVLEIGTGSGYQTAILSRLAKEVFTVERHPELSRRAESVLRDVLDFENLHFLVGDGTRGWPEAAPFDRILVTAAAPELPRSLFDQLVEGGRIVLPMGSAEQQQLHVIDRRKGEAVAFRSVTCRFVPLVGQEGWDDRSD